MVPDEETVIANMFHQMGSKNSVTLDIGRPEFLPTFCLWDPKCITYHCQACFLIANGCSGLISKGLSSPQILIICIWKVLEADLNTQILLGIFERMNKLKWDLSLESVINISFFKLLVRKDMGFFFSSKNCHWSLNGIMKKLKTHSAEWKQINKVPGKEGRLFFLI